MREPETDAFLAARLDHPEGDVYAVLYTLYSSGGREHPESVRVQLDIVEAGSMEEGLTEANPDYRREQPAIQPMDEEDYEGRTDHPLLSRFSGSFIYAHEQAAFDEYVLPTGRIVEDSLPEDDEPLPALAAAGRRDMVKPAEGKLLEGTVTKLTYVVPQGRSPLEVTRSYRQALEDGGFAILFTAAGEREVGPYEKWHSTKYGAGPEHRGHLLRGPEEDYYTAARLDHEQGDVYAAIYILRSREHRDYRGHVFVQMDIVEERPMEEGLVSAGTMEQQLDMHGAVALQMN